jgi:hypothetical protein
MTTTGSAVGPTIRQRWRTGRWVLLALAVIVLVAVVGAYLTAPRQGGRMDASSTSPDGAHALVTLLRDRGVDVVEAGTVADVERAATADSLVVLAETSQVTDADLVRRLAAVPGDRLLVEPSARVREALAADVEPDVGTAFGGDPNCDMPEAVRSGDIQLGTSGTFSAATDVPVTRCYDGAVVRYRDGGRVVTVTGTAEFMTNSRLRSRGNAALAMNLAGTRPKVVWYAPQRPEGGSSGAATIYDLIPDAVGWAAVQLALAVALVAVWKARRIGPLVPERLPVVVRASETVEGRGRLYRSGRARDRAADALRTATRQRLLPRLGLSAGAAPPAVVAAVAARTGDDPHSVGHALFGGPPATDADLVHLAHQLDDIERQVAQS